MNEATPEAPTVNSLLIAERVFRDQYTNEWVIAGVFDHLRVDRLPALHDRFDVFFQITNVSKAVDLHLRIEHADSGDVMATLGGPLTESNPLRVVEHQVVFRRACFTREGKYWIQLLSREEILAQAPLHVVVSTENSDGNGADEGRDIQ